jgi:pimeloyl-ACP methyl ester carboxylesterase
MAALKVDGIWDYGLSVVGCWHSDLAKLSKAYSRIKSETLLMWGDCDPAVFVSSAQEILRRIPQSQLKTFQGVGHLPYEEVPENFNRVLCDFLQ